MPHVRGKFMVKAQRPSRLAHSKVTASAVWGVKVVRFTRNKANTVVYALVLGWPSDAFVIHSLGTAATSKPGKIHNVQLLGTDEKLKWKQSAAALRVELSKYRPTVDYALALEVFMA